MFASVKRPTEHGDRCVASVAVASSIERVWRVVSAVERWPAWNPVIEWTSAEISGTTSSKFTLLSGRTLLSAELIDVKPPRYLHCRCFHSGQPQPPAADICVGLVAQGPNQTHVLVELNLESWFRERLGHALPRSRSNPALLFARSLRRVVQPPGATIVDTVTLDTGFGALPGLR